MKDPNSTRVNGFDKALALAIRMAATIGSLILLALALLGSMDVLATRILNDPIPGILELSEAGLAVVLFLGLSAATAKGSHIRLDILLNRLGSSALCLCRVISLLFTTVFFALWTWQMGHTAAKSWAMGEIAASLFPLPLYPVKFVVFLGLLVATVASFALLARSVFGVDNLKSESRKGQRSV